MIKEFISDLGGPEYVAAELTKMGKDRELNPKAVRQWFADGAIPYRWRLHLGAIAKRKKIRNIPQEIKPYL